MPCSSAVIRFALTLTFERISTNSDAAAGSSVSWTIAAPIFRPDRSLEASSRNLATNATASSVFIPFVYCGKGCVVIRPPAPSKPALFSASFAVARNRCASRIRAALLLGSISMKAVTARIRGRTSAEEARRVPEDIRTRQTAQTVFLKRILQRELEYSRISYSRDFSKQRIVQDCRRIVGIHLVRKIERLTANID